jgi:hypothetical protein
LYKQCPIHPKSWHTLFECITIRKSLNAPPLHQEGKRKDKEDKEGGDKLGAQDFKDPKNVINVIFSGDGGFPSKRAQKLTLHEILSVEPTTTRPLRYSGFWISFSRDDQWTSFSEVGKVNYRTEYIKFEVANFDSFYHAILNRPALAKFMAVPHYVYLLLKMPGKIGVLTLCGDLKKLYDCDRRRSSMQQLHACQNRL